MSKKADLLTVADGEKLIELAKRAITLKFENKDLNLDDYSKFSKKQGVFVTLKKNGELRGCIGYPQGYYPLNEATLKAAVAAAFEDRRFPSLSRLEFKKVDCEISVLTIPKKIEVKTPEDYLKKIKIGKDGLILKNKFTSGLLLPQVAPEWGWSALEFLENVSLKAGLGRSEWKEPNVEIYSFQAQIFSEESGKVVEHK